MGEMGEPGVVISRYGNVAGFDWLSVPLVPHLYAVDRVEDIPDISDAAMVVRLREHYRREHLGSIVPDDRCMPDSQRQLDSTDRCLLRSQALFLSD